MEFSVAYCQPVSFTVFIARSSGSDRELQLIFTELSLSQLTGSVTQIMIGTRYLEQIPCSTEQYKRRTVCVYVSAARIACEIWKETYRISRDYF